MGSITIDFVDATPTGPACSIQLSGGCFALSPDSALGLTGAAFGSLAASTGAIDFGVAGGGAFSATVTAELASDGEPSITVSGFSGFASVTWPNADGWGRERLTAGEAMALAGFTG